MLISIIVPVFNVYEYIDKCVHSILSQTYDDFELILVNDGSFDGSESKCRNWERIDNRIKVINQDNKGVSAARNAGITLAKGIYITFVDADDYLEKNFLYCMTRHIDLNNPKDIIICGYNYVRGEKKQQQSFFANSQMIERNQKKQLIRMSLGIEKSSRIGKRTTTNIGGPCMKLIRREFLEFYSIRFVDGLVRMQDTVFCIECFSHFNSGEYINEYLYNYVFRENSAVNKYYSNFEYISKQILYEITRVLDSNSLTDLDQEELVAIETVKLLYETIRLQYAHRDCKLKILEKRKEIKRICGCPIFNRAIRGIFAYKHAGFMMLFFCILLRLRLFVLAYLGVKFKDWMRGV